MALADDEKWILAENLKRQEKEEIAMVERGQDASGGDFGSYYALLIGKHPEWAEKHVVSDPRYLASYARQLRALLGDAGLRGELSVLDVGCGLGSLTQTLFETFHGHSLGVDISESAVQYARKRYAACRFEALAVDESMQFMRPFDLVHAREFYPFTRTGDHDFHVKYLEILARQLSERGILVLTLADKPKSLTESFEALAPELKRLGLTPLRRVLVAHARIPAWIPARPARVLTRIASRLTGRAEVNFYVARR